jgi:hypothetical protein
MCCSKVIFSSLDAAAFSSATNRPPVRLETNSVNAKKRMTINSTNPIQSAPKTIGLTRESIKAKAPGPMRAAIANGQFSLQETTEFKLFFLMTTKLCKRLIPLQRPQSAETTIND